MRTDRRMGRNGRERYRVLGIAAAALLACSALTFAPDVAESKAGPPVPERELRVINYNIQHGRGMDDIVDLRRTADVIADSGADVAFLQEVDRHLSERSDFADQASELGEMLGWHVAYGANIDRDPANEGDPRQQYGTAILSSYPILTDENILLPIHENSEQRGVLTATIMVRGVPVNLYNTHLQSPRTAPSPESAQEQRAEQVLTILEQIDQTGGLTILAGDLNAEPDTPEVAPLEDALVDVWAAVGEGPGFTAYLPEPDRRIDYVWVSEEIGVEHAEVPYTEASDHLPVVVDLTLPGRVGR